MSHAIFGAYIVNAEAFVTVYLRSQSNEVSCILSSKPTVVNILREPQSLMQLLNSAVVIKAAIDDM